MVVTQHSYFAKFITQVLAIIYLCIFSTLANASTPFCFVRSHVAINYPSPIEACNAEIALFNQYSASFVRLPQYLSCGSNCGVVGSCFTTYVTLNNTIQANSEMSAVCVCQIAGEVLSNIDFTCAPPGGQLSLTSAPNQTPPDPRPKGTEGKDPKSSTHELIAKVMEGSTPKAGVAVTFAVEPIANSGGHDHHDASRPKGEVKANSLTTDANGEIKVTFEASEFAGTHVVAAACSSCTNTSVTKNVDVKVPNLTQLTGGGSGSLYKLIGEDGNHGSNHWYSYAAKDALIDLLSIFKRYGWGIVGVNDSSLIWGGCFDVPGRWGKCTSNHAGHRAGEEVDISFYRPSGVSKDLRKKIYNDLKDSHKIGLPTILWHVDDKPNPDPTKPPLSYAHFHVYLLGQKQFNETPY